MYRETFLGSPLKTEGVLPFLVEEPPEAEVQPLHSRAPKEILLGLEQPDLPQASLTEHFERELPTILTLRIHRLNLSMTDYKGEWSLQHLTLGLEQHFIVQQNPAQQHTLIFQAAQHQLLLIATCMPHERVGA